LCRRLRAFVAGALDIIEGVREFDCRNPLKQGRFGQLGSVKPSTSAQMVNASKPSPNPSLAGAGGRELIWSGLGILGIAWLP